MLVMSTISTLEYEEKVSKCFQLIKIIKIGVLRTIALIQRDKFYRSPEKGNLIPTVLSQACHFFPSIFLSYYINSI